ncbi:permease for cytosine/purines, uracil, thiamine, allantoin-domain-containing protein [Lipomyces starkeyi]
MAVGLSWRLSLLCIALANIIIGSFIVINGAVGAKYHIPFSRASFGYYLSYLMIAMRMIVAIFWYGIRPTPELCNLYYSRYGPHFVPNHLSKSANITTQFMTAYVIYFLLCLPLHYVAVHRVKWLFLVKAIATPVASLAIMGWIVHKAGLGQNSLFNQGNTVHGPALGWAFMGSLYSNIGSGVTLMVNAPDYSRYSTTKYSHLTTAVAVPFTATVITTGHRVVVVPVLSSVRFAFCSRSLVSTSRPYSLAAANDMNCLFPKYINIRQGQFIAAFLGAWALTPWNILTSAPAFLNFIV